MYVIRRSSHNPLIAPQSEKHWEAQGTFNPTPIKQGKLTPGSHIPVKPYEAFVQNPPDYALLFAWNHAKEIFEKELVFKAGGGKWITFVPKVGVIE